MNIIIYQINLLLTIPHYLILTTEVLYTVILYLRLHVLINCYLQNTQEPILIPNHILIPPELRVPEYPI